MKVLPDDTPYIISGFRIFRYLPSLASPTMSVSLQILSLSGIYPENRYQLWRFLRPCNCKWWPIRCSNPAIFPVFTLIRHPSLSMGISTLPVSRSNFLHSDPTDLANFIFPVLNIILLSLYVYNLFTLDCFTLLAVLPKNKIRSIINSFVINTELPWLLIFLYCSPWTFSHRFKKTLLLFVLWQGTNMSNELLFTKSLFRLPGFPAFERQGYVLFKRTIIIFIESDPAGKSVFARDRKTIYFAIHLIAHLRKQ